MTYKIEIINPKTEKNTKLIEEVYQAWKEVWSEARKKVFCDDFLKQDEMLVLRDGHKIVAMGFMRNVDFSSSLTRDDSWFDVWPNSSINEILKFEKEFIVCSYYTITKDYRGTVNGIKTKDILTYAILKRFLEKPEAYMLGCSRKSKGVNKNNYKFGGTSIEKDLSFEKYFYDEQVDLILFEDDKIAESLSEFDDTNLAEIWDANFSTHLKLVA